MGWPVPLSELRETIRERYDLPDFTTTTHVKLAAVDAFINQAVRSYYAILQEEEAEHLYTAEALATTVANVATVPMPSGAGFVAQDVLAVDYLLDSDTVVPLARSDRMDLTRFSRVPLSWAEGGRPRFSVLGNLIYLSPTPSAAYSLRVWYVSTPSKLVLDTDAIDGGPGWSDYVVASVCHKLAQKDQSPDVSMWRTERDELATTIRAQCERKSFEPVYIRRTRRGCSSWASGASYASSAVESYSYDMGGPEGVSTMTFDGGAPGGDSVLIDFGSP